MPNTDIEFQLANLMDIVTILSDHIQQQELAMASTSQLTWQGVNKKIKVLISKRDTL